MPAAMFEIVVGTVPDAAMAQPPRRKTPASNDIVRSPSVDEAGTRDRSTQNEQGRYVGLLHIARAEVDEGFVAAPQIVFGDS